MKRALQSNITGISLGVLCALVVLVPAAFGIDLGIGDIVAPAAEQAGFDSATDETTFAETLGRFIRALISLVGIIFTLLVVYAGIIWMVARGNEGEVERAQKILRNSVIGLLITVGAYAITNFVLRIFVS